MGSASSAAASMKLSNPEYMAAHKEKVEGALARAVNSAVEVKAEDPVRHITDWLKTVECDTTISKQDPTVAELRDENAKLREENERLRGLVARSDASQQATPNETTSDIDQRISDASQLTDSNEIKRAMRAMEQDAMYKEGQVEQLLHYVEANQVRATSLPSIHVRNKPA